MPAVRSTNAPCPLTGSTAIPQTPRDGKPSEKYRMPQSLRARRHTIFFTCGWKSGSDWHTQLGGMHSYHQILNDSYSGLLSPLVPPCVVHPPVLLPLTNILSSMKTQLTGCSLGNSLPYRPVWPPCLLNSCNSLMAYATHLAFILSFTSEKKSSQVGIFCLTSQDK